MARPKELFPRVDSRVHDCLRPVWHATSLEELIAFRILQGLPGGGLQPSSQGVLLDAFPREKQGLAMTLFGIAALIAPVVGPTQHLRPAAVGLFALLRNEGGSVGTSLAQTMQIRRDQFHTARIGESIYQFNPLVNQYHDQAKQFFFEKTGDPAASSLMAWQALSDLRDQQASALAYFDCFYLFAVIAVLLVGLVLFMNRSVAEKGAHVGGE